jgi:hypothetical protein
MYASVVWARVYSFLLPMEEPGHDCCPLKQRFYRVCDCVIVFCVIVLWSTHTSLRVAAMPNFARYKVKCRLGYGDMYLCN